MLALLFLLCIPFIKSDCSLPTLDARLRDNSMRRLMSCTNSTKDVIAYNTASCVVSCLDISHLIHNELTHSVRCIPQSDGHDPEWSMNNLACSISSAGLKFCHLQSEAVKFYLDVSLTYKFADSAVFKCRNTGHNVTMTCDAAKVIKIQENTDLLSEVAYICFGSVPQCSFDSFTYNITTHALYSHERKYSSSNDLYCTDGHFKDGSSVKTVPCLGDEKWLNVYFPQLYDCVKASPNSCHIANDLYVEKMTAVSEDGTAETKLRCQNKDISVKIHCSPADQDPLPGYKLMDNHEPCEEIQTECSYRLLRKQLLENNMLLVTRITKPWEVNHAVEIACQNSQLIDGEVTAEYECPSSKAVDISVHSCGPIEDDQSNNFCRIGNGHKVDIRMKLIGENKERTVFEAREIVEGECVFDKKQVIKYQCTLVENAEAVWKQMNGGGRCSADYVGPKISDDVYDEVLALMKLFVKCPSNEQYISNKCHLECLEGYEKKSEKAITFDENIKENILKMNEKCRKEQKVEATSCHLSDLHNINYEMNDYRKDCVQDSDGDHHSCVMY